MSTTDHAPIAPSGLYITAHCAGNIKLGRAVPPRPETQEEKEGTAAHWVALQMALGGAIAEGSLAPNGVRVTDEMISGGYLYVDALEGLPGKLETRVSIPRIHATECWGTPDRWQWTPNTRRLRVYDYKYGHMYVEVYENWQLIAYAAGIIDELELNDDDVILELVIVQPRSYHADGPVRMWVASATKLRAMVNVAFNQAHAALGPNPPTVSGDWCLHCPARTVCPTLTKTTGNIMDFAGNADPWLQTPDEIGRELRFLNIATERLEARAKGLAAQAEALLRAGKSVPFFAMAPGQSKLSWNEGVGIDEVEALAQMLTNKSALKPRALLTPTQVIERKILDRSVMGDYSNRPPGGMKMVPDSLTKAAKVFQK